MEKLLQQLIKAVIDNDPKKVNTLLNKGVDPNDSLDDDSITPLHYAAQHDALEVVPLLIAAGADVHAATYPDHYTALDIAVLHEHFRLVKLLLAYLYFHPSLH